MIKIKRVYEPYVKSDGFRVLVDRLWPRGVAKEKSHVDLWLKEIAPTNKLRKWFNHDPDKWDEFRRKYKKELLKNNQEVERIKATLKTSKNVTLVYAAKDQKYNNAVVLQEFLNTAFSNLGG